MVTFYQKLTTVPIGNSLLVWKEREREGSEGGRKERKEGERKRRRG